MKGRTKAVSIANEKKHSLCLSTIAAPDSGGPPLSEGLRFILPTPPSNATKQSLCPFPSGETEAPRVLACQTPNCLEKAKHGI